MAKATRKVNIKTLTETFKGIGMDCPKAIPEAVEALKEYYMKKYTEADLSNCPVCNNPAPEKVNDEFLAACPFCGQSFRAAPSAEKKPEATVPEGTVVAKKKPGRPAKVAVEAIIRTDEMDARLESSLKKIDTLRTNVAVCAYDIGVELNEINGGNLWAGLEFKSFFEFCEKKLDFTRQMAYKYMACAQHLTRDEFLSFGVKKGELIAHAQPVNVEALKDAAKKGASYPELHAMNKKFEGKSSGDKGPTDATPKDKKDAAPPKDKKSVVYLEGLSDDGTGISIPWIDAETGKEIDDPANTNRYARIKANDTQELIVIELGDGMGLNVTLRNIS